MILEKIQSDLQTALRQKNKVAVSTLRFLLSAIRNREIELGKRGKLTDEEIVKVIRQQVRQRQESIEAYRKGKREDLARNEEEELKILSTYLPQSFSQKELEKIITQTIKEVGATGPADFGKVMGAVMKKIEGRAEGKMVAQLVKKLI